MVGVNRPPKKVFYPRPTICIGSANQHSFGIWVHIGDIGTETPAQIVIIGRQRDLGRHSAPDESVLKRPGIGSSAVRIPTKPPQLTMKNQC